MSRDFFSPGKLILFPGRYFFGALINLLRVFSFQTKGGIPLAGMPLPANFMEVEYRYSLPFFLRHEPACLLNIPCKLGPILLTPEVSEWHARHLLKTRFPSSDLVVAVAILGVKIKVKVRIITVKGGVIGTIFPYFQKKIKIMP